LKWRFIGSNTISKEEKDEKKEHGPGGIVLDPFSPSLGLL